MPSLSSRRPVPPLQPPAANAERSTPRGRHLWIWLGLTVLIALALAVLLLLPRWVLVPPGGLDPALVSDRPLAAPVSTLPAPQPQPAKASDPSAEKAAADRQLQSYLHSAARLELMRAPIWGDPQWDRAKRMAAEADRHYGQSAFPEAAQRYRAAEQQLRELEAEREPRLAAALSAGGQALEQNDPKTAEAQFQLALAIEPEHADATRGLARAKTRPALLERMELARQAEVQGDREAALNGYREAARMDPDYPPASAAWSRLGAELTEAAYREAMSQALSDLQAGRLERAAEALERAEQLKPKSSAAAQARLRLARQRQQMQLARLRRNAEGRARAEDWEGAARLYQQALQTEPNGSFGRHGLEEARERQQIHAQIDRLLKDPDRLGSSEPLANAQHLLATLHPGAEEPRLQKKLTKLALTVARATTPVPVMLHSDGQTEVVVYHVGRLGRFQRRSLELVPGRYTAVGSRDGYRDVRRELIIQADRPPTPILVRCEEPL